MQRHHSVKENGLDFGAETCKSRKVFEKDFIQIRAREEAGLAAKGGKSDGTGNEDNGKEASRTSILLYGNIASSEGLNGIFIHPYQTLTGITPRVHWWLQRNQIPLAAGADGDAIEGHVFYASIASDERWYIQQVLEISHYLDGHGILISIVSMDLLWAINGKSVPYRILVVSVHMGYDTLFCRSVLRLLSSHGEPQLTPPAAQFMTRWGCVEYGGRRKCGFLIPFWD